MFWIETMGRVGELMMIVNLILYVGSFIIFFFMYSFYSTFWTVQIVKDSQSLRNAIALHIHQGQMAVQDAMWQWSS